MSKKKSETKDLELLIRFWQSKLKHERTLMSISVTTHIENTVGFLEELLRQRLGGKQ